MTPARVLPALAQIAALAILAVGGAPARAADPVGGVMLSSGAAAPTSMNEPRIEQATARGARAHEYNLGTATASDRIHSGIGVPVEAGTEWSPRIADWSGYDARLLGFDRSRFNNALSGWGTVFDQHIRSRLTLSRHRIVVQFATAF